MKNFRVKFINSNFLIDSLGFVCLLEHIECVEGFLFEM